LFIKIYISTTFLYFRPSVLISVDDVGLTG
jgi:hypothetical protein